MSTTITAAAVESTIITERSLLDPTFNADPSTYTFWSIAKGQEGKLWVAKHHQRGWFLVEAVGETGTPTGELLNIRLADFEMAFTYDPSRQMFSVVDNDDSDDDYTSADDASTDTEAEVVVEVPAATICHNAMAQHISHYAGSYLKVKTTTGYSRICGDDLSELLRRYDLATILTVASGVCGQDLATKYAHLNKGQQRMNAGNILRRAVKDQVLDIATIAKALADWSVA